MPRPYDPEFPEIGSELPDEVVVSASAPVVVPPAPPPVPQAAPPRARAREAETAPMPERWAFRSRTIQRMLVSAVMFYIAQTHAALLPYVDATLAGDVVKMIFEAVGGLFFAAAARAKQIGDVEPPVKMYWLPRLRA